MLLRVLLFPLAISDFDGGGRGCEPRSTGGCLKLESEGNGVFLEPPERNAALPTLMSAQ